MINKLISLIILTFLLLINHSYSETQFLYPKKKPSIFKEINKVNEQKIQSTLPQKKPIVRGENSQEKQVLKEEKIIKEKNESIDQVKEKKNKNWIFISSKKTIYL